MLPNNKQTLSPRKNKTSRNIRKKVTKWQRFNNLNSLSARDDLNIASKKKEEIPYFINT